MQNDIIGFNIRVYGICIQDEKMLTLREQYGDWNMVKLPGGGLEYGEGVLDCLRRECKEELDIYIIVGECFYVQEDYIPSIVNDKKQILILYYLIEIPENQTIKISDDHVDYYRWFSITEECPFTLPVDKIMYKKLLQQFGY